MCSKVFVDVLLTYCAVKGAIYRSVSIRYHTPIFGVSKLVKYRSSIVAGCITAFIGPCIQVRYVVRGCIIFCDAVGSFT